jgi:hypothetical protein
LGVSTDRNGGVFITGGYASPTLYFNTSTLTNITTSGPAYKDDIFIAKILASPTGINEEELSNSFIIYPNPSIGIFSIKSSENISAIEIVNLVGEKIYQSAINSTKSEIDLSKQPNGIYFLQLKTEQGVATKKLIINK